MILINKINSLGLDDPDKQSKRWYLWWCPQTKFAEFTYMILTNKINSGTLDVSGKQN
jgi:hypothetical protein